MQTVSFKTSNDITGIAVFKDNGGSITLSAPIGGSEYHRFDTGNVENKTTFLSAFLRILLKNDNSVDTITTYIDGKEETVEIIKHNKTRKVVVIGGRRFDADSNVTIIGNDDGREIEMSIPVTEVNSKVISVPEHSYCKNQFTEYVLQQNNVPCHVVKKYSLVERISKISKNRDILQFIEETKAVGLLLSKYNKNKPEIITDKSKVKVNEKTDIYLTLV